MAVLVRMTLGGVESTLRADRLEADPIHSELIRLYGVVGLVMPEFPHFVVSSASLPRRDIVWYVEGAVPDLVASGSMAEDHGTPEGS